MAGLLVGLVTIGAPLIIAEVAAQHMATDLVGAVAVGIQVAAMVEVVVGMAVVGVGMEAGVEAAAAVEAAIKCVWNCCFYSTVRVEVTPPDSFRGTFGSASGC